MHNNPPPPVSYYLQRIGQESQQQTHQEEMQENIAQHSKMLSMLCEVAPASLCYVDGSEVWLTALTVRGSSVLSSVLLITLILLMAGN